MYDKPSRVTWAHVRFFIVALATLAGATLSTHAAPAPANISVLDSLTGDSTIVDGNVVYVDFWASWCVPCRRSLPWMGDLEAKYRDHGLQVVTINLDHDRDAAQKFLEANGAKVAVVYDSSGKIAKLYNLQVMPTSFVYGRDGTLKSRHEGFRPEDSAALESLIRSLLQEKSTR